MTNSPIENYVNQIKSYIKKNRNVYTFEGLEKILIMLLIK